MSERARDDPLLVWEVHRALRWYGHELRLAGSPLLAMLNEPRVPDDGFERAVVLRRRLRGAVRQLCAEDEVLGHLLERRFLCGAQVQELLQEGWSRASLFRWQRRAIVSLARIMLESR